MLSDEVKEILSDQLETDTETIDNESDIYADLGADKLDMIDIVMTIEDEYSIEITDEDLEEIKKVEDLILFIQSKLD